MMNAFLGIGRIANDLTITKTQSGKSMLRFSLAIDKKNKKKLQEANLPYTNYIQCVAWESTALTIHQYFKKGDEIGISGSVETRSYEDQAGKKVYVTEILVDTITFINGRKGSQLDTVDDRILPEVTDNELPF